MKRKIIFLSCIGAVAGIAAFFFFVPCVKVLSIHSRLHPEEMYSVRAGSLKAYEISYTHSVNKGRVYDYYEIQRDKTLLLKKTTFVSYGAGMPELWENQGAVFVTTDEGYVLENLNRKVPRLVMAVGIIANHALNLIQKNGDERYFTMTDLFAPQTSIVFEVVRLTIYKYYKTKL